MTLKLKWSTENFTGMEVVMEPCGLAVDGPCSDLESSPTRMEREKKTCA